jgi:hypothetical protein
MVEPLLRGCLDLTGAATADLLLADRDWSLHVAASPDDSGLSDVDPSGRLDLDRAEGPWVDCLRTEAAVSVHDLRSSDRGWPRVTPMLLDRGLTWVHAVPLRHRTHVFGSLTLAGQEQTTFGPAQERLAQVLAEAASIATRLQARVEREHQLVEQLQTALASRIVIEQAKGMISQLTGMGMDASYASLRQHARDQNLKLSALAQAVVDGGYPLAVLLHSVERRRIIRASSRRSRSSGPTGVDVR